MAQYTAGPWEFREIAPYDDGLGYISADGHDIIHAGVSDLPAGQNRANARLTAAAPELLAALEAQMSATILLLSKYEYSQQEIEDCTSQARAAIATAHGAPDER